MSGGSFDYACFKLNDDYAVLSALPSLREMERWLRSEGKHEAADELLRSILRLETIQHHLSVLGDHLYRLAYGAEWWCSGDWNEEKFDKLFEEEYLHVSHDEAGST